MDQSAAAITDFDDNYDPLAMGAFAFGELEDIYTVTRDLARKAPVHEGDPFSLFTGKASRVGLEHKHFTVLGEDAIRQMLSEPETFNMDYNAETFGKTVGNTLTALNDPVHGKVRRVFQAAFMPHNVARWGDEIVGPIANQLVGRFIDKGRAELVSEFALPFPFEIIYRQLNLPPSDTAIFHKMAVSLLVTRGETMKYALEASQKLWDYFKALIEERRRAPGDDLISALVTADVDGEHIPEDIMISFLRQLLSAGGDTTYRGTGSMMIGLLQNPDQLEAVRNDRSLVTAAVEEALRWEAATPIAVRSAARDTELGGLAIPKGAVLTVVTSAANRDPARYPDPDRFDIHRPRQRHLTFSYGPHVCIGQHLARLEMSRALNTLLDRLPNLRLDPDMPPPKVKGIYFRTPSDVHVRFD